MQLQPLQPPQLTQPAQPSAAAVLPQVAAQDVAHSPAQQLALAGKRPQSAGDLLWLGLAAILLLPIGLGTAGYLVWRLVKAVF